MNIAMQDDSQPKELAIRARRLRWVTLAAIGLVGAMILLGSFAVLSGWTEPNLAISVSLDDADPRMRWASLVSILISGLPFLYALWHLSRMLACAEREDTFSAASVAHLRGFALWVFVATMGAIVLSPLVHTAAGLLAGLPVNRLRVDLDIRDVFALLVSGLLFFVARLLETARRLSDDLKQIV